MEIQIEHNVPVPVKRRKREFPFGKMAPGDSFFAPGLKKSSLYTAMNKWRNEAKSGWKFTTAPDEKDGVVGARCWRTQ